MSDREAGGGGSLSRVAEWEAPRHPGTASQEAKYPTSTHSATQNPPDDPHRGPIVRGRSGKSPICSAFRVGRFSCRSTGVLHVTLQSAHLNGDLPFAPPISPVRGARWEELASACRERGDQRRGDQ